MTSTPTPVQPAARKQSSQTQTARRVGRPRSQKLSVGREALVRIACTLLKTNAPGAITPALVSKTAQVDPALIWYYFKGRKALLEAMAEEITASFQDRVDKASKRYPDTPEGRLKARIGALVELHIDHPFFHLLLGEVPNTEFKLDNRAQLAYQQIIVSGVREGAFRSLDAGLVLGAVSGMCQIFLHKIGVIDGGQGHISISDDLKESYVEAITNTILYGLVARQE